MRRQWSSVRELGMRARIPATDYRLTRASPRCAARAARSIEKTYRYNQHTREICVWDDSVDSSYLCDVIIDSISVQLETQVTLFSKTFGSVKNIIKNYYLDYPERIVIEQ